MEGEAREGSKQEVGGKVMSAMCAGVGGGGGGCGYGP